MSESGQAVQPSSPEPIIGIDLGTTNSLVAFCDESGPRVLRVAEGDEIVPSVLRFNQTGQVEAIGKLARTHAVEFPQTTIYSIKRLMGRSANDIDASSFPYQVVEGEHATARVRIGERDFTPQEISAHLLHELRRRAEEALDQPVRKAVITVPAYFDDAQRQATRDAGRLAGLNVVRMVNEPTAAALAYNFARLRSQPVVNETRESTGTVSLSTKFNPAVCADEIPAEGGQGKKADAHDSRTIAVFDLGGGTFDVSILKLQTTQEGFLDQVLATAGDTHLGGDDIDAALIDLMQREMKEQFGKALSFPPATQQAFRNFAEAAKIRLSEQDQAEVEVSLGDDRIYLRTLSRDELETLAKPWLDRAMACCERVLTQASLSTEDIDQVVLVGGSTRMPMVRQRVQAFFGREPYTALNPDTVVALGAAVQAGILMGVNKSMLLLDVIPLSLGIETMGGAVSKLIVANSAIPARATEMFSTYADGQTRVKIHVLQGERELVEDCRSLGEFELSGLPPMPAGFPKIEVTFIVDANGILSVHAVEKRTEIAAFVQLVPHHGLTREEIDQIEQESFAHAKQDMQAHRLIDLRNQARLDIRQIRRQLEKVGQQLSPDELEQIEAKIATVEEFTRQAQADPDQFHQALTEMDHATVHVAELAIAEALREQNEN